MYISYHYVQFDLFSTCISNECLHIIYLTYKQTFEVIAVKGILLRAIHNKNPHELIYINNDNQISQRIIKVFAVNDNQIKAYCYTRKQLRTFKLENILSVAPLRKKVGA